jgi:hypothetical protein
MVENIKRFDMNDLPDFDGFVFRGIINYGNLCVLTEREQEEMKELWSELAV